MTYLLFHFWSAEVTGFNNRLPKMRQVLAPQIKNIYRSFASTEAAGGGDVIAEVPSPGVVVAAETASVVEAPKEELKYHEDGTSYIMCGACKTAYIVKENLFGKGGLRVMCNICRKEWFQNNDKVQKTDREFQLLDMTEGKIAEVKKILYDRNFPKYPRVDKIGIFIGNLPYTFEEQDIYDLIAEYGVTSVSLVRDPAGQSKGFAFAEVGQRTIKITP